jgi:hypothetical protein
MWLLYLPHYFEVQPYKAHFYITQNPFGTFWEGYGKWIVLVFDPDGYAGSIGSR